MIIDKSEHEDQKYEVDINDYKSFSEYEDNLSEELLIDFIFFINDSEEELIELEEETNVWMNIAFDHSITDC